MAKLEGRELSILDRHYGYSTLCAWCGFAWSYHCNTNNTCPAAHPDGSVWRMQYDPNHGAPGTTYKASETDGQ